MTRAKNIISWILAGFLAMVYAFNGVTKLLGVEFQMKHIASWEYSLWVRFPIGLTESVLAIGLLIPQYRKVTAYGVFAWTVVAVITHLRVGQANMLGAPIFLSLIAAVLLWMSKK